MKVIWLAAAALLASACSSFEVSALDPKTGFLKASVKATTIVSKPFNLDARKDLILVQNDPFVLGQTQAIGYFNEVITAEQLEIRIIQNNLGDKVPSVSERIGLNNAAKHYKPFLWLHFDINDAKSEFVQIYLTDPLTMEDVFVAEVYMDTIWAGVNDDNAWYPLFNELIAYVRANSATYGKTAAAPAAAN